MKNRDRVPSMAALLRRRTWNEEEARRILAELAASGETVSAFARRFGLVPQRLWWWQKRLGEQAPPDRTPSGPQTQTLTATFLPVTVRAAELPAAPATMALGGGVRVELRTLDQTSALWVAQVLAALGATP